MAGGWTKLWALLGLAALTMAPVPALAQADRHAQPYSSYPTLLPRADRYKPADQIASETAAADSADAACKTGDAAGCAALGNAYVYGTGRPQVRQIGEILLRRACDGGSGKGCSDLARLLLGRANNTAGTETIPLSQRACTLGEGEACQLVASAYEQSEDPEERKQAPTYVDQACKLGVPEGCEYPRPSPAVIERRAKAGCDSGTAEACRALAALWMAEGRSARDRTRGLDLLDRQCRGRDPLACAAATEAWQAAGPDGAARVATYRDLGCTAGDAPLCTALGKEAMAKTPEDRAAARSYFERACESPDQEGACKDAAELREEPGLGASCNSGDQRACVTLGLMLYRSDSVLLDRPRAIAVLAAACRAGAFDACRPAADYTYYGGPNIDPQVNGPPALDLLTRGCDGGDRDSCAWLADQLESGQFGARDIDRALALYVQQCEAGRREACNSLVRYNHPAAPVAEAEDLAPPGRTPEELAAEQRALDQERDRAIQAFRDRQCKTTVAEFEGVTYSDTMCDNKQAVFGGFEVNSRDDAPWQALIWRPAKLGSTLVGDKYRTECGGSVIATGWIITAAHCLVDHVEGVGKFPIDTTPGYRVRLGVLQPLAQEGNSYPILDVIPHPDFKRETLEFDIALVRYDAKAGVRLGSGSGAVASIKLDNRSLAERPITPKAPVYTFGWGWTAMKLARASDVLKGAKLELRGTAECTGVTRLTDRRRDSVLCAAGPKGEQACFGDSGGPLITYADEKGVPTLIGVVSGGVKCGTTGTPSRYTRIGHPAVQRWLVSHVPGLRSGQTAR